MCRYIELLEEIEVTRADPDHKEAVLRADILAFQGKFSQASREYVRAGLGRKAVEMYLDLRDWKMAQEVVENLSDGKAQTFHGMTMVDLFKRQAQWLIEVNDQKAAAEMYWGAQEFDTAISILGENGWLDELILKVRKMDKMARKQLAMAASFFEKHKNHAYAREAYIKMEDIESLMALHIKLDKWQEAFALAKENPQYAKGMFLPYAQWLAMNDRFEDAQRAFQEAGSPGQSLQLLQKLTKNAIVENRYEDAGYYYWLLAQEHLDMATGSKPTTGREQKRVEVRRRTDTATNSDRRSIQLLRKFIEYEHQSQVYYAYASVYNSESQPFTVLSAQQVFETALFLLREFAAEEGSRASRTVPYGVSTVRCLMALVKQSRELGACKLARKVYERLSSLSLPPAWRREVELGSLTIRTKPFTDNDDIVCTRCASSNPLLGTRGSKCVVCGHAFVYSFSQFDTLPVVEFKIQEGIDFKTASRLMAQLPGARGRGGEASGGGEVDMKDDEDGVMNFGEAETMAMDGGEEGEGEGEDVFTRQLMDMEHGTSTNWPMIEVDAKTLAGFHPKEVFAVHWGHSAIPTRYFKLIVPHMGNPIVQCRRCQHLFAEEDFETYALQAGACPLCRLKLPEYTKTGEEEADQELDPLQMMDSGIF